MPRRPKYVQTWHGQFLHDGQFAILYPKHNNHPHEKFFLRDLIAAGKLCTNEESKIKKTISFCSLIEWADNGEPLVQFASDGSEYPFLRLLVREVDKKELHRSAAYLASWTNYRKKSRLQSIEVPEGEWDETATPKKKLSQVASAFSTYKVLAMIFNEGNDFLPFGWARDPVNKNAIEPYIDFEHMTDDLKHILQLDFE